VKHTILLDTGPLVALLDKKDQWHSWAVSRMKQVRLPWLTTEAIITEACFLLAGLPAALKQIEAYASSRALRLLPITDDLPATLALVRRYANVPMSFADASLVRQSESHRAALICTIDSDFSIYRREDRSALPLLAPFAE
jgi:predicted nucleic acid-binding protein